MENKAYLYCKNYLDSYYSKCEENYLFGDLCKFWEEKDENKKVNILKGIYFKYQNSVFSPNDKNFVSKCLSLNNIEELLDFYIHNWIKYLGTLEEKYKEYFDYLNGIYSYEI